MLSPEIKARIKNIELRIRRMLDGGLVGDYTVAKKGYGLEFEQLADYNPGDDIRYVDWKSSARMNKMLIKEYREERNRIIILAVDCSGSTFFGSQHGIKYDRIAEIAAVLAFVALHSKDQIGLILFSDTIECYMPPRTGKAHVHRLIEKLLSVKQRHAQTSLTTLFDFCAKTFRRQTALFVVSDFIDADFERALAHAAVSCEITALCCTDQYEHELPYRGFIMAKDSETGQEIVLDTRSNALKYWYETVRKAQTKLFARHGIDCLDLRTGASYIDTMVRFFQKRMRY